MSANKRLKTETNLTKVPSYNFSDPNIDHDFVLVVDGTKFHVLSGLLSPWSTHFKDLFASKSKDEQIGEIEVTCVAAKHFEVFLLFIYPTRMKVNEHNVIPLIEMSHRFGSPGVMSDCQSYVKDHFDTIDVLKLLELSIKYELDDIKVKIGELIFASPLVESDTHRCGLCKFTSCRHRKKSSVIRKNSFIDRKSDRILKLSSEAQSFILQASVGNFGESSEDKQEDESEESEMDCEDEEYESDESDDE